MMECSGREPLQTQKLRNLIPFVFSNRRKPFFFFTKMLGGREGVRGFTFFLCFVFFWVRRKGRVFFSKKSYLLISYRLDPGHKKRITYNSVNIHKGN